MIGSFKNKLMASVALSIISVSVAWSVVETTESTIVIDVPSHEHTYVSDTIVHPTCTSDGTIERVCTKCGVVSNTITIRSAGHIPASESSVSEATCEEEGVESVVCSRCGIVINEKHYPALGHDLKRVVVEATCEEIGYEREVCSRCGVIKSEKHYPSLGHDYKDMEEEPATCTKMGSLLRVCSTCGKESHWNIVALGHDMVREVVEATCTEVGYDREVCSRCGVIKSDKLYPATGHTYKLMSTKPATCTVDGYQTYVCSNCKDAYSEPIAATGHNYKLMGVKPATCTEAGHSSYICSACKDSYSDPIAATGHSYKLTSEEAATCTEDGLRSYTCSACEDSYDEPVTAKGHNFEVISSVEPTCTKDGMNSFLCLSCSFNFTETFKALGHDFMRLKEVEPTCDMPGYDAYACGRCDESYEEEIPAEGHDYKTTTVLPSFCCDGADISECTKCPSVLSLNPTPQLRSARFVGVIQINEVMPCNISTMYNWENYNFSGYVEFYNSSDQAISLKGAVLKHYGADSKSVVDYDNLKWLWEIDTDINIPANGYTLVWMDQTSQENPEKYHSPYKLDADGGALELYAGESSLDRIVYGKMDAHISYGRWNESISSGYMEPTPGKENKEGVRDISKNRCGRPSFSVKPGVMKEPVSLTLSTTTQGAAIYYTLDNTEPSLENGLLYTEPIEVTENINVRAIACKTGYLPSKILTGSYIFMDENHSKCGGFTVPIVSITMDEAYYSDDVLGMFVVGKNGVKGEKSCSSTPSYESFANYHRDWKRPVNFEFIVDGNQVVSQEAEAAIEGGCSRGERIKSYSIKTSKKTGTKNYGYKFYDSWNISNYANLHLRNGGTAYGCLPFRDGLMQTFAHGMNIDYQGSMPVAYYRNGKYVHLMTLNERMNADYVKAHYGYDDDEIDLISLGDQKGVEASKGTKEAYDELVSYLTDNNPNNPGYFEGACERMDMDEYIDYQIFQQFIVNTDWPGNNTKLWRAKENGRFRWMLYDTDFGFGLCDYDWLSSSSTNMIQWCQGGSQWANNQSWMVEIFKSLSANKEFEKKFTTRYLINLTDRFSEENINKVFDDYTDLVSGEYCAYYGKDVAEESSFKKMREFALQRPKNILEHLKKYVGGTAAVDLTLTSSEPGAVFTLNGENISSSYKGKYIAGYGFDIVVYPPSGYQLEKWEFSDKSGVKITDGGTAADAYMPGLLSGVLSKSMTIKAIFKKSDVELPTLVINEICASSDELSGNVDDYNSYPDWIEVYNYGAKDVNLSGFRFSLPNSLKSSDLPWDADNLVIKAGEHKLLWAKGDKTLGSNYLDFKLSNGANAYKLCLSVPVGDSYENVDCITYVGHETNASYGRKSDGGEEMTVFGICDDNLTFAATPGASNGSVCEHYTVDAEDVEYLSELTLYPNPASDYLNLATEEQVLSYKIYDMSGCMLRYELGDEKSISVEDLNVGFYMIEVETVNDVYRTKFLKE